MTDRLNGPGAEKQPKRSPQEACDFCNAKTDRTDIEWAVRDERPTIMWKKSSLAMLRDDRHAKPLMDRRGQPMSESDTFRLNRELESLGATVRYNSDGTKNPTVSSG